MALGSRLAVRIVAFAALQALGLAACVSPSAPGDATRTPLAGDSPLVPVFATAAAEEGVPAELLATIAYTATRLRDVDSEGGHSGPARTGLFALAATERAHGASLAGLAPTATDPLSQARIAAALLREQAPRATTTAQFLAAMPASQRAPLAATLARGIDARDESGGRVVIAAQPALAAPAGLGTLTQALVGYEGAEWVPASTSNYSAANRKKPDVDHIVIHTTEGQYNGTLSWFQDPAAKVSAHYVVRSADGHIAQMVDEKNIAWHDKCFNTTTIGVEHEAFSDHPDVWFTEAMYSKSATLVANIADRYGIEKVHGLILGHGEAPDCSDHEDPGPYWDWDHYLDLVRTGGAPTFDAIDATVDVPTTLLAGESATVTIAITNHGNATWSVDETRLGTAAPQDRDSQLFVDGNWIAANRPAGVSDPVAPGGVGTFTFEIVAPAVREPTDLDEVFQLVEGDGTWFGPDVHVVTRVMPSLTDDSESPGGGCTTGGAGSGGGACAMVALGALVLRRSRKR